MFKKDNLETPPDKVNTVIGKGTTFEGKINGKGLIRIDGEMQGSIINKGDAIIGESGQVKADLKGRNITVAGQFEGTLEAEGRLELKRTSSVMGTFKVNNLLVEDGANVNGSMEMKLRDGAPDMSIKKKVEDKTGVAEGENG